MEPHYISENTLEKKRRELGLSHFVKLGFNENPYGPFPSVISAMRQELENLNRYSDENFLEVKRLLAEKFQLDIGFIAISHGAENMLQTLSKCFINEGDEVIIPKNSFRLYQDYSKIMGAQIKLTTLKNYKIDLDKIINEITENTKLIWLCNPNNPTGTIFSQDELIDFLNKISSDIWVVVDEAYAEFVNDDKYPDLSQIIQNRKNVMSVRTFSKAYGLAGARLGYVLANREVVAIINRVSQPFNANRIALAGAKAALLDKDYFEYTLNELKNNRNYLMKSLHNRGFNVVESHTNFVFFEGQFSAKQLQERLLKRGIFVQAGDGWGYPQGIRVTVGTWGEIEAFLTGLDQVLQDLTT